MTILDVIFRDFAEVAISQVAIVVSSPQPFKAASNRARQRHGITVEFLTNDRPEWNNAYSLWLARDILFEGALLTNGDTLHPVEVERALLAGRCASARLAVDAAHPVSDEAMKVTLDGSGRLASISKRIPRSAAFGEYIGVALIGSAVAAPLTAALRETWETDPDEYYEGGFQRLVDGGGQLGITEVGRIDWVEVDDGTDLARARELACRC